MISILNDIDDPRRQASGPKVSYNQVTKTLTLLCPGCGMFHILSVASDAPAPKWSWNEDVYLPTLTPSLLVTWMTRSFDERQQSAEHFKQHGRPLTMAELPPTQKNICHSFVRGGTMDFLSDSTHAMSGKTGVPMLSMLPTD